MKQDGPVAASWREDKILSFNKKDINILFFKKCNSITPIQLVETI